jgi:uncharacterized integral membrane protein
MNIISKIIWLIVFVVFFGFAMKNDQIVTLNFFLGYEISAPLVILLLTFFIFGTVICLLAMLPIVFRHRRTISRHQKTIEEIESARQADELMRVRAPTPDSVANT